MFHMNGGGSEYANAFARQGVRTSGRESLFGEFSELSREGRGSTGRRSLFSRGMAGDAYRLGQGGGDSLQRSKDLRFDVGL